MEDGLGEVMDVDMRTKKEVQGIYLTYLLRYSEYALRAYLDNDLEGLWASTRLLAAMLPSDDFDHERFYAFLDKIMEEVEADELDTEEEREAKREEACRKIYEAMTTLVTPVLSSLGIRIKSIPVFTVGEGNGSE